MNCRAVKKAPSLHCFVALQDITCASPGKILVATVDEEAIYTICVDWG